MRARIGDALHRLARRIDGRAYPATTYAITVDRSAPLDIDAILASLPRDVGDDVAFDLGGC